MFVFDYNYRNIGIYVHCCVNVDNDVEFCSYLDLCYGYYNVDVLFVAGNCIEGDYFDDYYNNDYYYYSFENFGCCSAEVVQNSDCNF